MPCEPQALHAPAWSTSLVKQVRVCAATTSLVGTFRRLAAGPHL